jgi:hypothetical protein
MCGLLRRLDLLFHWLECSSKHCTDQLGCVVESDSGFDALLDQLLPGFFTAESP